MTFLTEYGTIILFYLIIGLLIYKNKKKFDIESKFIMILRTRIGIKLMKKISKKAGGLIRTLGIIGVYIGFIGMIGSVYMIIDGLYKLFFVPGAPPTFAPVIPGVKIPGFEVYVPFWYGIIGLFIVVVIHEFSHGVVAESNKLRVKNSGFVMFGPLPGAFVEPDEKELRKASTKKQLSVYAAGPFSNILLTIILIILFGFTPMIAGALGMQGENINKINDKISIINFAKIYPEMYKTTGIKIGYTEPGSGAAKAGIPNGTIITMINGADIRKNETKFSEEILNLKPGEKVIIGNDNKTWTIITGEHPKNKSRGYMGIAGLKFLQEENKEAKEKYGKIGYRTIIIIFNQILWIIILSLGIGLANLLPLGPVDGGRMLLAALESKLKKEKAEKIWKKVSAIVFLSIIILIIIPLIKGIIAAIM